MNEQEKFWELIKQVRFELYYLDEYISSTNRIETAINGITAVASSASIAGWALWKEISLVWAGIIAASQVINALRPILPFTKRLKLLQDMHTEISKLSLEAEGQWFGVSHGDFTEREINSKLFSLKGKQEEITNRHLGIHVLAKKSDLVVRANASLDQYLQANYLGKEELPDVRNH